MYYLLVDSYGKSIAAFPSKALAVRAWYGLIRQDAAAAEEVTLLVCDSDGVAVERVEAPMAS